MRMKLLHSNGYTLWAIASRCPNSPYIHLRFDNECPDRSGHIKYNAAVFEAFLFPTELERLVRFLQSPEVHEPTQTHKDPYDKQIIFPV